MHTRCKGAAAAALALLFVCSSFDAQAARRSKKTRASSPVAQLLESSPSRQLAALRALDGVAWGLGSDNQLMAFSLQNPGQILRRLAVSGLADGEQIVGIDVRPRTGELYALSASNRLYLVDALSGAARAVNSEVLVPALEVASFGVDFNPVPDRLRVVGSTGQNLRLNPDTGAVASNDPRLVFDAADPNALATPQVVAAAYTNSFLGSTSTTNYAIDAALDILVTQGSVGGTPVSPNTGRLFTVGALGVDANLESSLDIDPSTGAAYLVVDNVLHTVDLTSGAATRVGAIGDDAQVRDLAISVRPELLFALTADGRLLTMRAGVPGRITSELNLTGIPASERLVGIDFRPKTSQLYAVDTASRVYTIEIDSGKATQVGNAPFAPALDGFSTGLDFNPVPDRIRLITNNEQNLRLNPDTGATAGVDTALSYDAADLNAGTNPLAVGAGYTNSRAGATSTTLYVIEAEKDVLTTQGSIGGAPVSPNTGRLFTIGKLGIDVSEIVGFDIAPRGNAAFLAATAPNGITTQLYTVNLNTGSTVLLGELAGGTIVTDVAIGFAPAVPSITLDRE
jgi:hypothetical protein